MASRFVGGGFIKQIATQKLVLKLHSTYLKEQHWDVTLPLKTAQETGCLIHLASNTILRFIDELTGIDASRTPMVQKELARLQRQPSSLQTIKKVQECYNLLHKLQFCPHYLCLMIDKKSHYKRANKGFSINGISFRRLLGTPGGIKNATIVYVSESLYPMLKERIDNGRDKTVPLVPAKLEAYQALTCSASIPLSNPIGDVLVVKDCILMLQETVITLDDTNLCCPKETLQKDAALHKNINDGFGLISPAQAISWGMDLGKDYLPSGFCIRNSWCKGMLYTFDFHQFAKKIANTSLVTDIWGHQHQIEDISFILTESMLKLWNAYPSIDAYLEHCKKNHYTFSATKVTPQTLDHERCLNYQFLQSFSLSDEDLAALTAPTIQELKEVLGMDYRKTLVYAKGKHLNAKQIPQLEDNIWKALMIRPSLIDDPYIQSRIHFMLKKRIDEAKTGVIQVHGNYSFLSGDPYALCQHIFGLPVTGLLPANSFYSKYWNDQQTKEVAGFRAPMTSHNNIRKLPLIANEETAHWYAYLNTVTILNCHDTTTEALNGCDFDGDLIFTTDNPILLSHIRHTPTLVCVQRKAPKKLVTEDDIIKSNLASFGDAIGETTNHITSMFEVQSRFSQDSPEYRTLGYRIRCGQLYQQNAIDKTKGIDAQPMPRAWYDYKANLMKEETGPEALAQKAYNLSILAEKKPYFMIYIYPKLKKEVTSYQKKAEADSLRKFGQPLNALLQKTEPAPDETLFLDCYEKHMPVGLGPCVINRLCKLFEEEFQNAPSLRKKSSPFPASLYPAFHANYTQKELEMALCLLDGYQKRAAALAAAKKQQGKQASAFADALYQQLNARFQQSLAMICANEEALCSILLDLCKEDLLLPETLWNLCGKTLVQGLLRAHEGKLRFPVMSENPDFFYNGIGFRMEEVQLPYAHHG